MKDFETTILEIDVVAQETKKIIFTKPEGFSFKAGQFLLIKFAKKLMRAYSIASTPDNESIELVIRIVPNGQGSTIIDDAKVGDKFTISSGMGHFVLSENNESELFFLATGTGIAPFKSMIQDESKKKIPRKMTLLYGGRKKDDLAYLSELSSWAKDLKVKLGFSQEENADKIIIKNLEATIEHCRITKFVEEAEFSNFAEFYICGNKGMVNGVKDLLLEKGVEKSQIFSEKFN